MSVRWEIDLTLIEPWLDELDDGSFMQVVAALELLSEYGPNLGRPLVDSLRGSRHRVMKELRPGSAGRSEVRLIFAFDQQRTAVFLVAGDKSGEWSRWYRRSIPVADDLFDQHRQRQGDAT
jgi:hypothetical protein